MEETAENWLNIEFNHAKYTKNLWGRSVIQAIDMDNCIELYNSMHKAGEKIDTQMTILGYDQYLWTSSVHKFLGDTALHLAMRQRKMMCVHMLLILKAKTNIANAVGITAEALSVTLFSTTIKNLEYEAFKFILNRINLKDIPKLPDSFRYRHIEKEAWKLMEEGRILYSELPTSFAGDDTILNKHLYNVRKNYLSFNLKKPSTPAAVPDNAAANTATVPADGTAASALPIASANPSAPWVKEVDREGKTYYYNQITGESSWEKPAGYVEPPSAPSTATSSKTPSASTSAKTKTSDKKGTSSATSSASNSRSGTPSAAATRPGKMTAGADKAAAPSKDSKATGKAAPVKDAKGAKAKQKGGSDSESASSKNGGKGKSTKDSKSSKSTKGKGATLSTADDSGSSEESSQASSVGSLRNSKSKKIVGKGKSAKAGSTKVKKKGRQSDEEEEVVPKVVVPPRPRTLREQYEDSGTKMTQRAELEVLREDIKQQTELLRTMAEQSKVVPGVSVPPLPQDFAITLVENERKLRSLQKELIDKSRVYYASINTPNNTSPGKRGASKAAKSAPIVEVDSARRGSAKVKTGVAAAPSAALATGDVWGRDNLCDVIYLIERQKTLYFERMLASRQPVAKGLKLLDSVKIDNSVERVMAHERDLQVGKGDSLYIPEDLYEMQGVKKLRFMNLNKLRSLAQTTTVAQANSKTAPSARLAKSMSDKILFQQDSSVAESLDSTSLGGGGGGGAGGSRLSSYTQRRYMVPEPTEYETMREITKFSTHSNMKYMKIGDEGAESLGIALQNDGVVSELCLAGARITCVGATLFAKYMPDIKSLQYLDLSNNAISDKGAVALAAALPFCVLLEQLNLMGNRIASVGAVRLIQAVFSSPLHWLSLKNNLIVHEEMQIVLKLLEECNYYSELRDGIFEPNTTPSIGMRINQEEMANSSVHNTAQQLKLFVL